ncbi:MAG: hypothetical protein IT380_30320 [Myxococcales bacterium]|nr:hypothetical protein [Myxococcales bacterium]
MEDFIFTPIVLAVGVAIHLAILRRHTRDEGRLLTVAFAAHVASAIIQVLLVLYYFRGGGDMLSYFAFGVPLAEALRADFPRFGPELLKAFLQFDEFYLPAEVFGTSSTQSMSAATGFLLFLLGNSLYAACVAVGIASYVSQVMIFRALRGYFRPEQQQLLLIGATLLPSAVFWSSAVLKEPLIIAVLGPLLLGLQWFSIGTRRAAAIALIVPSAVVMAMIKPYVLMTLSISASVFYLWSRFVAARSAALRPFAVFTAIAIGAGGLVLGNRFFVKGETETAAAALAGQRRVGYEVEGGSNYRLEDGAQPYEDITRRSLSAELALAPVAMVTAFFRPFIFEARNAVQLANALEATYLLVLFVQVLRRRGWKASLAEIRRSPAMMFCVVFAFALALGTGLATTNMGTLSRYRAPMMPFFFALLLILRAAPAASAARDSQSLTPAAAG